MTPTELLFKLKNLPSETPITAEHIIAILGSLQAPQTVNHQAGAYSTWDNDKLIDTETLSEWIGEIPSRLKKWRVDGVGPKFISKAKHVAYRVGDVRDWLASRTVQSTTQADRLSFVSAFDDCFVEPTIYHDQQPYSLFESIELFGKDAETNITGFELFITKDDIATLYMQGNFDALENLSNINEQQTYFINGEKQQGTLAHLIARHTAENMQEWMPFLLNQGLDFSAKDGNGKTAFECADDTIKNYLSKRDLMLKLSNKLPTKGKSPVAKE
ncbi:hypothetical protein [Delftia acidovorans]|uniref:hypothetical protein n=1 Tax=Delftia acidovorans TaxID=80866 RepID=UPI003D114EB9